MSFEGYYQILCKKGHYDMCDCYEDVSPDNEDWRCSICGDEVGWWNIVDETNGSYCSECEDGSCGECDNGRIDGFIKLEINKPGKYQKCNLNHNHVHEIEAATYKIPEKE